MGGAFSAAGLCLLVGFAVAAPAPPAPLDLEAAIDRALCQQPNLRIARELSRSGAAAARVKRAALLPQLTLSATYQRTTANFVARPGYVAGGLGGSQPVERLGDTYNFFNLGLQGSQLLFDFGASLNAWRSAEASARQASLAETQALLVVYNGVAAAFFALQTDLALARLQRDTEANQRRHLADAHARAAAGVGAEVDVAQARAAHANAQLQVVWADANVALGWVGLAATMGEVDQIATDVWTLAPATLVPLAQESLPTPALTELALGQSPQVRGLTAKVEAQRHGLAGLRGQLAPQVGLTASLSDQGASLAGLGANWSVGAQLSWPAFSGLGGLESVRAGEAQWRSALAEREAARLAVAAAVATARARLRGAAGALAAARLAEAAAGHQLALAEGQYRAGAGSYLNLDDAQLKVTAAATQALGSRLEVEQARAALVLALGDATLWAVAAAEPSAGP